MTTPARFSSVFAGSTLHATFRSILAVMGCLAVLLLAACGGGGGGDVGPSGPPALTATETPPTGSVIGGTQAITILFSRTVNTASLALTGGMSGQAAAPVFTQTNSPADTLTITPATTWSAGIGRTLTVMVNGEAGGSITLDLTYDVGTSVAGATASPVSAAIISSGQAITITFTKSMDPATLNLTGSMAGESDGGVWSTVTLTDDTLTVSPGTSWSGGAATLSVDVDDTLGNAITTLSLNYTVDITAPMATGVAPVSGSTINSSGQIVIAFDESMDTTSLAITGTMAGEANGGTWSTTTNSNDTLTISPSSAWSGGMSRTLTVDAADVVGNPLTTLNLSYDVDVALPTAGASPVTGSKFNGSHAITITFSESMDTGSLVLGGTMAAEDDGGVWSGGNMVLTVSPATSWSDGAHTLTVDAADEVGNNLVTLNLSYDVDATPPTLVVATPANGSIMSWDTPFVLRFDESLEKFAVFALGTTDIGSGFSSFTTTVFTDDTWTISPSPKFNVGDGRKLDLQVTDKFGNVGVINLTFDILSHVHVSTAGSDTNSGNAATPMRTIVAAMDRATSLFTVGGSGVRVAGGIYGEDTFIRLDNINIGLSCGWSANFSTLDPNANPVTIQDNRISGGSPPTSPLAMIILTQGSSVGGPTISGCSIFGAGGTAFSTGIWIVGTSAWLENNFIDGGELGITLDGAAGTPFIFRNTIIGTTAAIFGINGVGSSVSTIRENLITGASRGIWLNNEGAIIERNEITSTFGTGIRSEFSTKPLSIINNTIDPGSSSGTTTGVSIDADFAAPVTALIYHNTISGGAGGTNSTALDIEGPARVNGNILFTDSGTDRICYRQNGAVPIEMSDNDLFDCPTALFFAPGNADETLTTTADMEAYLIAETSTTFFAGNVSVDPLFVDQAGGDWHLDDTISPTSATSPCAVLFGSADWTDTVTLDKDGFPRSGSKSMGAYQYGSSSNCGLP